jgi:hypothetical protein
MIVCSIRWRKKWRFSHRELEVCRELLVLLVHQIDRLLARGHMLLQPGDSLRRGVNNVRGAGRRLDHNRVLHRELVRGQAFRLPLQPLRLDGHEGDVVEVRQPDLQRNGSRFLSFPYVCTEPVWVK